VSPCSCSPVTTAARRDTAKPAAQQEKQSTSSKLAATCAWQQPCAAIQQRLPQGEIQKAKPAAQQETIDQQQFSDACAGSSPSRDPATTAARREIQQNQQRNKRNNRPAANSKGRRVHGISPSRDPATTAARRDTAKPAAQQGKQSTSSKSKIKDARSSNLQIQQH
jgi:hypothetical protein